LLNYDSSLQVQNLSGSSTTFQIRYYRLGESEPVTLDRTVGAHCSMNLWHPTKLPADYLGSAVVEVTSGGPVAAMAQYDHFNTSQSRYGVDQYEGVTAGTRNDVLPHVQRSSPWTWTGIMAQNMGDSAADLTLDFYHQSGSSAGSATQDDVDPETGALYWSGIPNFSGSAVVSSSPALPVGLMVDFDRLGRSWTDKDGMMGYGAVR
jgi:hypothetical protein